MTSKKEKLRPSVKKAWIDALRSGKYKQANAMLRQYTPEGDKFCCLGVLCDIYRKIRKRGRWDKVDTERGYVDYINFHVNRTEAEDCTLPRTVRKWTGLEDAGPVNRLIKLNDNFSTFNEIADEIERTL